MDSGAVESSVAAQRNYMKLQGRGQRGRCNTVFWRHVLFPTTVAWTSKLAVCSEYAVATPLEVETVFVLGHGSLEYLPPKMYMRQSLKHTERDETRSKQHLNKKPW